MREAAAQAQRLRVSRARALTARHEFFSGLLGPDSSAVMAATLVFASLASLASFVLFSAAPTT
jgi:hypothetical protein